MKKLFFLSSLLACNYAIAQFPSGSSIPGYYSYGSSDLIYKVYTVDVKKKDGKTEQIHTSFNRKILPLGKGFQFYLIQGKGNVLDTILPDQTTAVIRKYQNREIVGIPNDSLWLFEVISGKITGYVPFPEEKPKTEIHEYFLKKGDGPMIKYSEKNDLFAEMIKENAEAVKAYKRGGVSKMLKAIEIYNRQ